MLGTIRVFKKKQPLEMYFTLRIRYFMKER